MASVLHEARPSPSVLRSTHRKRRRSPTIPGSGSISQRSVPMKSNVLHLRKPKALRPAPALALARTAMRAGRKHRDPGLAAAGKDLLDQTNASLAPKESPNLSSPGPSSDPAPSSPSDAPPSH